jgi:uncharacterized protein YggE
MRYRLRSIASAVAKPRVNRAVRVAYIAAPLAAIAVLALMLRPWPSHRIAEADGPPRNGITISAEGSASLPPDTAHISGNILTQADAAADALGQNQTTLQAVIVAVKGIGATDQDIQTTGVQVSPISSPQGQVNGYQATNQISVTTKDLSKVGDLIQAMVSAGISNLNSVNYALQDPTQLQLLATQAAIGNARSRAQAVAGALGEQLGGVLDFSFGAATPPPPAPPIAAPTVRPLAAPAVALAPPPPVNPTSFSTTTQVTVTFAIAGQ